ncbi:macro domain-containing protein [Clostridium sp. TF11-13AC]|uniref:type II toxin-antitoxin system antitoxin DNA ADP-ribosyl glycohydrolase DarG n=1 Tax=Clostridium sp. TF11-13AC TaxID=2293053 RepID=UPI000E50746D|nr:macro domain-containing protein [Clostridium sp. TF11-13AC]RHU44979.1 Appr-1-p processing protein [Clostridium sp. TF11-13AC]
MKVKIGNIFESKCSTLVNTINCVGVMGKGIALEFKKKYPEMFFDYVNKCKSGQVQTGTPYVFDVGNGIKILNFPTKNHWRSSSKLSFIIDGLDWFIKNYGDYKITSIAFPPLGCGNGGLSWESVGPIMYQKLINLPIEIEIYAPFGTKPNEITNDFLSKKIINNNITGKSAIKINPTWYLILEAVKELNSRTYSLKVGRTIYQKICYVMTRNGIKTGFIFSKGSYGPYSANVKDSITALANANLITEQTLGRMISLHVSDDVIIRKSNFSPEEWNAMKKTVDLFGRIKSTEQAEIMTTVLYSYDELYKEKQALYDKDIYDFIMSWKPHWKQQKEAEVCSTINNLAMLSLISVQHSNSLPDKMSY